MCVVVITILCGNASNICHEEGGSGRIMPWKRSSRSLTEHLLEQAVLLSLRRTLEHAGVLRHHPRVLGPELLAGEVVHEDAHALYQPQQHPAHDGAAHHALGALPRDHHRAGRRPRHDRVPGVLLLADVGEGAVEGGEADAPGGELAAQHGGSLLDLDDTPQHPPPEPGRGVPRSTDHVEEASADKSHGECSPAVVYDPPWTRLPGILLHDGVAPSALSCRSESSNIS